MSDMKEIIGITGGIGSGKSVVSRILRLNGFSVYDCDMEARLLMENDPSVRSELISLLGEDTYDSFGKLSRVYVASRIFSDPVLLSGVNKIVHAAVREHFRKFAHDNGKTVFCESAILATSGLSQMCDRVWIVEAAEELRISRVKQRNGLGDDEIRKRIRSQEKEMEQLACPKVELIDNSGTLSLLKRIFSLLPGFVLSNEYEIQKNDRVATRSSI